MSTINFTAHGLVGGERVVFSNVVPTGTGVDEDVIYTVLAAGITADAFQISETGDEDDPLTFTLNVTSADMAIVPETTESDPETASYVAVTDVADVHAPPTTPATPDSPSVASIEVSGVTRLSVVLASYSDAPVRIRSTEVNVTHRYSDTLVYPGTATGVAATDIVTLTGHGLLADVLIRFSDLVGGTGIDTAQTYYVLAAGLTADTFQFSLTSGGAAVDFTADITSATISQVIAQYPDWDYAQVINLPWGTTDISVPCIPSTGYAVRSRVLDVYGNTSAWSNPVELITSAGTDSVLAGIAELATDIPDGIVSSDKIVSNAIIARHILAGEITADKLATTLLLASLIRTAESGRRIEIDVDGIRLYDASEVLLVRIPTDGTAVYVNGEVNASTLTVEDLTTINGAASLSGDAVMTLQNGISAPTSPPTLTASVDYTTLTSTPGSLSSAGGIAYDSTGDSGAGSFWVACNPTVSPYYVAQEFAATATNGTLGRLIRSISATGSTTTYTTTAGSTTHVSDTANAYSGSTNSHIATPITMPSGRDNMKITKVAAYLAGYGGTATCRNALWTDVSGVGNAARYSDLYTAASESFVNGNSNLYNKTLTSSYSVSAGTIYAGFYHNDSGDGIQYDKDDGTGKTTYGGDGTNADGDGWGVIDSEGKPNVYVTYTYDVDTRLETATNVGVATDGTHIYTLDSTGVVWKYLLSDLSYVSKSSVQTGITGTKTQAGLFYDATAGELLITTTTGTGTGVYPRIVRVVPSTLAVSTSYYDAATGPTFNGATDTFRGGARLGADVGGGGSAAYWIATTSSVYAYTFATTVLTNVSDRDFGLSTTVGDGLTYDGTVFRGWDIASPTKVWKFSTWDWTTGGTTYWVGFGWSDGTSQYTECGPTASVTVKRRQRLQVQNAALPGGVADAVRVYAYRGASDAAAGSRYYQNEDALTARYITAYATATADPTTNGFSAGNPAELKSDAAGWSLKGDGSAIMGDLSVTDSLSVTSGAAVDIYLRGGVFKGTTAVTLNSTVRKNDLSTTVDGESAFLDAANDRVTVPTGAAGIYLINILSKTPTGIGAGENLNVYLYKNGAAVLDSGWSGDLPSSGDSGHQLHGQLYLADGDYLEVWVDGSSAASGTSLVDHFALTRIGRQWIA